MDGPIYAFQQLCAKPVKMLPIETLFKKSQKKIQPWKICLKADLVTLNHTLFSNGYPAGFSQPL